MSGRAKIKVEEKTRVNGDKCGGEPWTEMSKQGRIGVYKKRTEPKNLVKGREGRRDVVVH